MWRFLKSTRSQGEFDDIIPMSFMRADVEYETENDIEIGATYLQIISVEGLDNIAIALLTDHLHDSTVALLMDRLQAIHLPTGLTGELVFELQVSKGRVRQVVFDKQSSSLQDAAVIKTIRQLLLTWKPPQSVASNVRLTLALEY